MIAPKGLICNAIAPAATGAATIGQGWVITLTTAHAISKLLALSEESRKHSQGVTHGTMAALFTGDTNQHGEPFGNQLIDAQVGGGGANPFADGLDQTGCFVSPRPHIPNIEYNEIHSPMLFLYRSFFPDTGGDGEQRGGRAAGTAWTPHGVERLRCSLTSHGVEVPISYGQFGGFPGVCSNAMIIHESDIRSKYAQGELPLKLEDVLAPIDLDELGGQPQVLAAKQDELPLFPGDIVQYTWQGGGGYGDRCNAHRRRWQPTWRQDTSRRGGRWTSTASSPAKTREKPHSVVNGCGNTVWQTPTRLPAHRATSVTQALRFPVSAPA